MKSPFIVAEMSANHLGSLNRALNIVDEAAWAGADAIKVQTWTPGSMCIDRTYTLQHGPWAGKRLVDLYEQAFLPWEWHASIFQHARARGLIPFSAAFDCKAVDFLCELGVDRLKVASFELTDLPLIRYMASKGKPMILSTGMATLDEIRMGVRCAGNRHPVTILKCTSAYPAAVDGAHLTTMASWMAPPRPTLDWRWGVRPGLSDHTPTHEAAVIATALGATMIEKHLTLSRAHGGPDAGFSLEPHEFKAMVEAVTRAAQALGEVKYGPQPGEDPSLRRSLWVAKDTCTGGALVLGDNVVTARPARGLSPATPLEGKRANRALFAGTPLQLEDLA